MRTGKFIFVGLPFILLIAYMIWVPSPIITKIENQNDRAYLADGYDFRMVQLTPQGNVIEQSLVTFDSAVRNFTLNSNQAYVITKDGLISIIEIRTDLPEMRKVSHFDTPGVPQALAIRGDFAYIADGFAGVQIFSIHQISQPSRIGFLSDLGFVSNIIQIENLTYVVRRDQGLDIYELSNYTQPRLLGHYDAGGTIGQATIEKVIDGDRVWIRGILLVAQRAVQSVDLSDPQQPGLLSSQEFVSISNVPIKKVFIQGRRIFAAQGNETVLIARNKDNGELELLATITGPRVIYDFAIIGDTAYLAGGFKGVQAFNFSDLKKIYTVGTPYSNFWGFKIWIVLLSFFFLLFWLAFFAQFVLPVQSFLDRQKIFNRLITYLLGRHGPAIFVENGHRVERAGESMKDGPGVAWLDTASATVIRTATKFKEVIGPGVHFTEKGEFLTEPIDLHIQTETLGPTENDKPFDDRSEDQDETEYAGIQNRRMMTSALTRDGIEVVPNITIVFRVDTKPVEDENLPGSHFGYRTGTSQEEKAAEKEDKEAIYKAIAGEGVDPTVPGEIHRHRVAWNQLPGRLAVDIWREYVAKFTLDELFLQSQPVMLALPEPSNTGPTDPENKSLSENNETQTQTRVEVIAGILREFNSLLVNIADWLEDREKKQASDVINENGVQSQPAQIFQNNSVPEFQTALQVINEMVKKRLTQPATIKLGDTGERIVGEHQRNFEYDLLQERRLKVINVSISNLQFSKKVDEQIISQWTANWLNNAKSERERLERRQKFVEMSGEEEAANEYVHTLSRHIVRFRPRNARETLKALIMRSRLVIARDNQLQKRMSTEWQNIEDILRWLENRQ